MQLFPVESATNNPKVGGFIAKFPSGAQKSVIWASGLPIEPTIEAAKKYAATLIDEMMKEGRIDDVDRTNWASATAAIQKIIADWNVALRQKLYANTPSSPTGQ